MDKILKSKIIRQAEKAIQNNATFLELIESIFSDKNEGHKARLICERLLEADSGNKDLQYLEALVMDYYFGDY